MPDDSTIYVVGQLLNISCIVTPDEIINANLITTIRFLENNSTIRSTSGRFITYDGINRGTICFKCGHFMITPTSKCYSFYGMPT